MTDKAPSPPVKSTVETPESSVKIEEKPSATNFLGDGSINHEVPEVDEDGPSSENTPEKGTKRDLSYESPVKQARPEMRSITQMDSHRITIESIHKDESVDSRNKANDLTLGKQNISSPVTRQRDQNKISKVNITFAKKLSMAQEQRTTMPPEQFQFSINGSQI